MKKISEHLGAIIAVLAGVALLIGVLAATSPGVSNMFGNTVGGFTEAGTNMLDSLSAPPSIAILEKQYDFTYYSALNKAISDVNAETVGTNADATKENAVVGVYTDKQGTPNVVLLKDASEANLMKFDKSAVFNLGGNTLTASKSIVANVTGVNLKIDGRLDGSEVITNMEAARTFQMLPGVTFEIEGGKYTANSNSTTKNAIVLLTQKSTVSLKGCELIATNTGFDSTGISISAGVNELYIDNCKISATSEADSATIQGIATGDDNVVNISNSEVFAHSEGSKAMVVGLNAKSNAAYNVSNSVVKAFSNYSHDGVDYTVMSIGIQSVKGNLTVKDSYVYGTHSGITSGSTTYINGGTYEGFGHGGLYLTNNLTGNIDHYIENATFKQAPMPEGYTNSGEGTGNGTGMYIGGNESGTSVTVYANNCEFMGLGSRTIVMRGSGGEENNTLYISNSELTQYKTNPAKIIIDDVTHKVYIGQGCNFDADDTTKPACVTITSEAYTKP